MGERGRGGCSRGLEVEGGTRGMSAALKLRVMFMTCFDRPRTAFDIGAMLSMVRGIPYGSAVNGVFVRDALRRRCPARGTPRASVAHTSG